MAFFELHVDRELSHLGGGTLPPRRWRRVLEHSRSCHRCASRYERAIRVLRQLEHRSPFEPAQAELEAITALNARSVDAQGPRAQRRWWVALLGVAVASALVLVLARHTTSEDELTPRGAAGTTPVAVRLFCGGAGAALSEVKAGAGCAAGRSLAFAVGAAPGLAEVALRVSGSATSTASTTMTVKAGPGAEEPVDLTVQLERGGEVEVVAAFAADPAVAEAAARGEQVRGAVVLRRTVKVAP